ncbi:Tetratricopeptide repeat protein 37 [Bulinus truncatus]|nr:Tetratricopeptide repeat protein 37 [Bulinus truncatus]
MDANEIKACLKKARDAIREKDFKEALKQSKVVLTVDKDNYNALVFIGLAAEGLNQPDQALKAFRKASEKDPDQLLAWQGLASFMDKNPTLVGVDDAINIYQKLLALTLSDSKKQITFSHKLVDLFLKNQNKGKALELLEQLLNLLKDDDRISCLKQTIILLAEAAPKIPQDKVNLYQSALSEILQAPSSLNQDEINTFTELQLLLLSSTNVDALKALCEILIERFPDASPPKEFMLNFLLDNSIGQATVSGAICEKVKEILDQLLTIRPESPMIKMGQGFLELQNKNFAQASVLLQDCSNDNIGGLYYLSLAYLALNKYSQCLETCKRGLTALSTSRRSLFSSSPHVKCLFKLAMANAYREINTNESRENAISILEEVSESMPNESVVIKSYVLLDQGKTEEAEICASYLPQDSLPVQTLKATILYSRKDFISALKILKKILLEYPENFKATLKLGQILWELRDSHDLVDAKQQCFVTLIKAAKLDPNYFESFLYLGYYYRDILHDKNKARKCFQKAYDLNPSSAEAGSALVDSLMEQGEESQSVSILELATSQAAAGHAKWAWLRRGLHQFKHNDYTAAINSLQSALRGDPSDNHVWECLAEAYLHRGSYTAALRAFTKASELDPDSLYCLYKTANIKQILGHMTEAVQEYKKILEMSPAYVPVLKGVAESLIQLGKENLRTCLDGQAKTNFEDAIVYLTRAAAQRPDMSCLWKLLGDACTFIYTLAVDSFSVPDKLLKKTANIHDVKVVTKNDLIKIGASCYTQALKIFPESGSLWHDLGINLYYQSQLILNKGLVTGEALTLLDRATQSIKKAVNLEPKDWRHWNVLGVIACCKASHKPALAQHCFIKSIECDANNAVAWTNLGAFYLDKDQVELAYKSFQNAQSIDPTYTSCWIGQAMIAERVGHGEAMDLFRHSTELGFHLEGAIGYSQFVLSVLGDPAQSKTELYHYNIQQMAAIPAASDALIRYTRRIKNDPLAYNMLGLLFEHQNLLDSSVVSFQEAISLLEKDGSNDSLNDVRINLARVLSKQGKYVESIALFEKCPISSDVLNSCFYGLTLFKFGRVDEAFKVYRQVLNLVKEKPEESQVFAALGMMAYQIGDMNQAKSLLFNGFQTSQPSLHGLLALCALGLLQNDKTLSAAVFNELNKRGDKDDVLKDISFLKLYKSYLEDCLDEGMIELKNFCESNTGNLSLWKLLGESILRLWTNLIQNESFDSLLEILCFPLQNENVLQSLGQLLAGWHHRLQSDKNALRTAQKAFHTNPGCLHSLSALVAAVHAEAVLTNDSKSITLIKVEQNFLNTLLEHVKITSELKSWCHQMLVINNVELGNVDSAKICLQKFQESKELSPEERMFQKSLTSYFFRKFEPVHDILNNKTVTRLQILIDCDICCQLRDYQAALNMLERLIQQNESQKSCYINIIRNLKERLAYVAYCGLKDQPDSLSFKKKFEDVAATMKDSPIVLLLDALRALAGNDNRKAKHLFAMTLDKAQKNINCSSLARQWLLKLSWGSNKDSDLKLLQNLLQDADINGDYKTLEVYKSLSTAK